MFTRYRDPTPKGSYRWALRVAEMTAWGTAALVIILLHAAGLGAGAYRSGLAVSGLLVLWLVALFRIILPRYGTHRLTLGIGWGVHLLFATLIYAIVGREVTGAQLIFVPVIIATGLLGELPEALVVPAVSLCGFTLVGLALGPTPDLAELAVTGGVFFLSGAVAGLLAKELRSHYRGEREEHQLATAVRHRLMTVVDAVDEAIVFSDRHGVLRVVNRRAAELFDINPDEYLGLLGVQLLRTLARKTEDPEGFMEAFQDLRDDPELELRREIEQIIPERRVLRLYSAPALDESGALVGRIDVYTDLTDSVRRAAEVERLLDEARRTAESYQRSLLPDSVPSLPRVTFVAHYVPAAGQRAVCGDFYDFVSLPDGRAGVVLGDVCGVGPTAVGDGALTRYTLESFADQDSNPGRLLERMNAHIYEHLPSDRFVRLVFGILDPERAVFEYANAGHVPPVIYRCKTEEAQWLGEGGIALAVEEDAQYKVGRVELEPGDMLVLYTDGVTESPRLGRPYGQARFRDLVQSFGKGTPGEMSQAIRRSVDAWVENGELRDDLALLVCQVVADSVIHEPSRELVLPNETSRLREIRKFVSGFLSDLRTPVDVSSEILIAVNEAAANACKYAKRSGRRSEIRVHCSLQGSEISVVVADDGNGFDPTRFDGWELPDRFASGGRGLFLMRELMDDIAINSSVDGTTITLSRRVATARN